MDPGSDPGRDEYGLPPVEVEVPDDARDLERDIQAYHRELRALRRRTRLRRLAGPAGRRGLVIPLVAGCLALTLFSGTLLTVIAGRQVPPAGITTSSGTSPRPGPTARAGRQRLPDATVTVNGRPVRLRSLAPAVLAWVPAACGCTAALRELARQAVRAHVRLYLVGTDRAVPELPALAAQAGQPRSNLVNDGTDALAAYHPMGLTAILADSDGTVGDVVRRLPAGDQRVVADLPALASTRQGSGATPALPVPAAT